MTRRLLNLTLALTPGIGAKTLARVRMRCELFGITPKKLLSLSEEALVEEFKLTRKSAAAFLSGEPEARAREMELRLDAKGVSLVTAADGHYPRQLEEYSEDSAGTLYMYGNTKLLESRTFAVLNSRNPSEGALEETELCVQDGVLKADILVSGHSTEAYQRSAVVPLRWGAPRILVLDCDLFEALGEDLKEEPFRLARLWRFQFDARTDLVISPINPGACYHRAANRQRDLLIGGLSSRLDLVSVSPGGNMHKLANLALSAGRPVRVSERTDFWPQLIAGGAAKLPPFPEKAQ